MTQPAETMQFPCPSGTRRLHPERRSTLEIGNLRGKSEVTVCEFAPKARISRTQLLRHDENLVGARPGIAPAENWRGQRSRQRPAPQTLDGQRANFQTLRNVE